MNDGYNIYKKAAYSDCQKQGDVWLPTALAQTVPDAGTSRCTYAADGTVKPYLAFTDNLGSILVYGSITVKYMGNNLFKILPDLYDFDIHFQNFFNLRTMTRNIETIGANILHGSGTPFRISFKGYYRNK